jgi:hypothetical protein
MRCVCSTRVVFGPIGAPFTGALYVTFREKQHPSSLRSHGVKANSEQTTIQKVLNFLRIPKNLHPQFKNKTNKIS